RPSCNPFALFSPYPSTSVLRPLSLHDALPIYGCAGREGGVRTFHRRNDRLPRRARHSGHGPCWPPPAGSERRREVPRQRPDAGGDRKSTRLNSSHVKISYAVFSLKKETAKVRP